MLCLGAAILAPFSGQAEPLGPGRAKGYYTHSGKGGRSAEARYTRFKARNVPKTVETVAIRYFRGRRYYVNVVTYDYEAAAAAARASWQRREAARARSDAAQSR